MKTIVFIFFAFSIVHVSSCKENNHSIEPNEDISQTVDTLARETYNLNSINKSLILSSELREISGLTYFSKEQKLLCINDEKGIIYKLDTETGNIIEKINFGKNGDYEGIEMIGDMIYTIRSNGNIYPYSLSNPEKIKKIKTAFSQVNDVEGLGKNIEGTELWIACKGSGRLSDHNLANESKSVYRFSLESNELDTTPFITIPDEKLEKWTQEWSMSRQQSKSLSKKFLSRAKKFSPSGIAIHPFTQNIYILSSIGKLLVELDQDMNLQQIYFLNEGTHSQPEGITFDDSGNMYISNEGKGLIAKIFMFEYSPK